MTISVYTTMSYLGAAPSKYQHRTHDLLVNKEFIFECLSLFKNGVIPHLMQDLQSLTKAEDAGLESGMTVLLIKKHLCTPFLERFGIKPLMN